MALLTLLQAGDHIVAAGTLYGGTRHDAGGELRASSASRRRSSTPTTPTHSPPRCGPNTRRSTPRRSATRASSVLDIAAVAEIAHAPACRWSSTTRCLARTCAGRSSFGADIVVHSATKYLGGHGTTMGGVDRRVRQVPLGQRQVPGDDRALARLPRRELLRDLRRLRLHDEGAHGDDARSAPRCRRSTRGCCCRASRRCRCAWSATAQRARGGASSCSDASARELGQLPRACRTARSTRSRSASTAAGRVGPAHLRRQGRRRGAACASSRRRSS